MMNKENNMYKFQVGDLVVRTEGRFGNSVAGQEHTVKQVNPLRFKGDDSSCTYSADAYELVRRTSPPTLTPKEVLQAVVDEKLLQVHSTYSAGWIDVVRPERICLKDVEGWQYRVKPSTVQLNGKEVVQPKLDNMFPYKQECFTLAEGLDRVVKVVPKYVADAKLYWSTHEDAQLALEAITAVLRGE